MTKRFTSYSSFLTIAIWDWMVNSILNPREVKRKHSQKKIQQTKMLVASLRLGVLFLFGLVWQYSSVQPKYDIGMFKVILAAVI